MAFIIKIVSLLDGWVLLWWNYIINGQDTDHLCSVTSLGDTVSIDIATSPTRKKIDAPIVFTHYEHLLAIIIIQESLKWTILLQYISALVYATKILSTYKII